MPACSGNFLMASSTVRLCAGAHFSKKDCRRPVITAPGDPLLTCTPSLIPCSANALASALMAALIAATAAYPGLGAKAALPDMNTTDPFEAFKASQASMVKRRAPFSLSAMPSSHCASVIWNKSICGTAPAMLSSAAADNEDVWIGLQPSASGLLRSSIAGQQHSDGNCMPPIQKKGGAITAANRGFALVAGIAPLFFGWNSRKHVFLTFP